MSNNPTFDEVVRRWALERASSGSVQTAEVATRFNLTTASAAKRLASLRDRGFLEPPIDHRGGAKVCNEITELGRAYLARSLEAPRSRQWDCRELCRALGEGMLL